MKTTKYILTLVLAFWSAMGNLYAVDKSYYNSIDGKSGSTLREALTTLTYTKHTTDVGYNWTFDGIDIVNGEVLDIYSTCTWTAAQQGKNYSDICEGYNREHLVPQSVFDERTPQRSDRHHLFLADGKVNQIRSSYPFGETDATNGFSGLSNANKALGQFGVAASGYTGNVYEPDDEYKGDVARAVLYMVIRYATSDVCKTYGGSANAYPVTTWSNAMFSSSLNTNYGLSDKAKTVFLAWHRADPVSPKEVARNNGVEAKQGNRNPFIDLPDLVEYLWGNHAGETVNLSGLTIATGGGSVPTPYELTLNRHGVTQTLTCTGTYTLPTASTEENACDGWEFKGWTTSSDYNNTTAPTYTTSVSSAATLYAVYGNTSSSAPIRKALGKATSISVGDQVVFVCEDASKEMTSISTTGTKYGIGTAYTTTPAGTFAFDVVAGYSTGTVAFKNGSNYLYWTSGNSLNVNGTLSNNTSWKVTIDNSGNATIKNASDNSRQIVWNSGSPRFATYSSPSIGSSYYAIQLYKNSSGGGGGSTTTYKTSPDCGTLRTITLSNSGVVTGGDFMANVSSAYPGATITLTDDPDPGYEFGSWTVTKQGGGTVTVTNNQFTMPDANVTVSATFNALTRYNIRFFNNGSQIGSTQSVYVGGTPNIPADPEGCDGYTFVGWYTASLATNNTTSHTWVTDFTVSAAQDYYAVFAHTKGGGGSGPVTETYGFETADNATNWVIDGVEAGDTYKKTGSKSGKIARTSAGNSIIAFKNKVKVTSFSYQFLRQTTNNNYNVYIETSTDNSSWTAVETYAMSSYSSKETWYANSHTFDGKTELYVRFKCHTSTAVRWVDDISITYSGGSSGTTYYTSTTSCASACTTLATPVVTATPGNGQITLTWPAVADADHYTVTISSGSGYTTECGSAASIGEVTGTTTKTCVITGLTNGLEYTTTVVANATSATCDSEADTDTATPQDCTPWDDPTLSWNKYSLNTTTNKTATKSLSGTTHGTLSFESSNPEVLTVDGSTGAVTAVGAGEATVTAHWTANGGYCEKTMTSSTFEVAGPLTISFDANGGSGTMTAQTVTYKVAGAIKTNTFTRTGYTFQGWALTADGEKTYDDKQSVAFTNSLTLYAVWQLNSHTVSFTSSITGATVTVNGQTTNQTVAYGSTVTVHITPADHYTITTVSIKGATSGNDIAQTGSGETRTFTMPDENVSVTVLMVAESQYTATFYNGTASFATVNGYVDDDINAPVSTPASCDDDEFTFIGWVTTQQTTEATTHPEIISFPQTMPSGGVTYYALFRRSEGGGGGEATVTFNTAASDGNTAYTDDEDIKANLVASSSGIASFSANKAYKGTDGVKLGASGGTGYITLNLNSHITTDEITVVAAQYGTDTGDLQIEVNGSNSFGEAMSPAEGTLVFTNDETVEIEDLTISTTSKRAYVASITLGSGGTSYFTTAPVCTPCEFQVSLTKGTESNGTFTLNKTNGNYDNCKTNFSVTVSGITPATGYYCTGVTATGGAHVVVSGPDGSGNYTINYAKGNSITSVVTANFAPIPTYTVTWSIDGDESRTEQYKEGDAIDFSHDPGDCSSGKKFMGWSAVEVDEQDEAPEYVTSETMATSPITYYAVFAEETTGSGGSSTFDGSTPGAYKIYAQVGDTKYYATGTGSKISSTTNAAEATEYTFESVTGGVAIKTGDTYITYSGSTNLGTNASAYAWTFASGTKGTWRVNSATSGRAWIFRAGTTNAFGGYSTSNVTAGGTEYYDLEIEGNAGSSTTYSGYTTSCEVPTNVTVTFNANGGTGTMTDQTISYNTPTLLKPNEFTREGYTFQGWATTADGSVAYDDKGLVTFKRRTTTLYAVWALNSYTITLVQPSGGTISSSPAGSAEYGSQVMIMVTPDSHHTFSSMTVTKDGGGTVTLSGSGATQSFTMPADNVTVTASLNLIPTYTVTWSADGDETNQVQYIEGESIVFPATAEGCEGKTFVGWSATQFAETDEAPAFVTSAEMGTSNLIYYAVYADASSGGGSTTETYGFEDADNATNWTIEGPVKDDTYAASGTYAGKINTNNTYITFNNKVKVTNFSFKLARTSTNSNYNVYVETSTDNSVWTAVETYPMSDFSNGSFTAKSKDFDGVTDLYVRFHCYNTTATRYVDDISITYGGGISYSGYTTSCGASISARNGQWITSADGQKVKAVLRVSAKNFDEATTLSASSNNSNFALSLAETAVPATAAGLTTDLTIEYTPASAGATESATITLTAGAVTKTITVNGRSLPNQFLILTKKASTWYALPANMTSGSKQYEGVVVTPNNNTTPTAVSVSPSTLVYSLKSVADARYASAGQSVRLVGNNDLCLWGEVAADETGIQNSAKLSDANGANTDWQLTTADGVHYQIANPNHADFASGRQLSFGLNFGQYEQETELYFVSTGCNSQPQNVHVSARRGDATFSWVSNAAEMHIDVYSDEGMTALVKSATATAVPYYMDGLTQETDYWYRLTPDEDTDCAVTGTFHTSGPTIDVVEWREDTVVILVDKPEDMHPKIVIAGQEEHGIGTGVTATELFFSKYFEGAGNMKLISIYNGTTRDISLTNYKIFKYNFNSSNAHNNTLNDNEYPLAGLGTIRAGQEIIFFTRPLDTETSLSACSSSFLDEMAGKSGADENPRWIECDGSKSYGGTTFKKFDFSGNDPLYLYKGSDLIDIIGAYETAPGSDSKNCRNEPAWAGTIQNMDYRKSPSDTTFNAFYEASSVNPATTADSIALLNAFGINLSDSIINATTARCVLFRYRMVTSGENAVANNSADFASFTPDEWRGRSVCVATSTYPTAGVSDDSPSTCNSYQDLGTFNYSEYYMDWKTIGDDSDLSNYVIGGVETGTENLYELPIDNLAQYSCLNLQFLLLDADDNTELSSVNAQVPILVKGSHATNDPIFNEIMKTDGGVPLYDESIDRCKTCEVLLLNGATLTKASDDADHDVARFKDITLYPGSKLIVPSETNFTVNTLTCRVEGDDVPLTELVGNLMNESKQLVVTRRITNDRYYFFSLPYDCRMADIRLANGAPATNGVNFRLLEYDADARAEEGSHSGVPGHWKLATGDRLIAGKGYALAVNSKKPKEIVFPMTIPSKNLTNEERTKVTNTVDINEYVGAARNTNHNWNLIAHPYITKFEVVSGAENVEAYWESPSRENRDWVDDWQTWEDPTQPTDTTHTQNPDSTETHIGDILESGTVDNGLVWVLYANATMELTGGGQMVDFSSLEAVPWAQHRQFIKDLKIGGDVQKIGKYAFSQCTNLVTVTIAAPVTNLASYAFAGCTQLRSFRIESTQYISATTTTFDGVSTLSVYVPQSMYDQYLQNSPWNKMALSAFDGSSTTGGDGSNTNPTPRRAVEHPDGWTESPGGIYVTRPTVTDGKITYEQLWINAVEDIPPFTAMFIQGDGRGEMTFNMYPASPAPKRNARASRYETKDHTVFVGVSLHSANGMSDLTSLRLRPDFGEHYKFGQDLLKFTVFNTSRPQLYIKTPDDQLAFRAISDSLAEHTWIPVGVYCRDAGTYTFSLYDKYVLDEIEAVHLHDNVTGVTTNLLYGNYTIETTKQLYTNTRFTLNVILRRKVEVDTPTVIEHTENPNAPRKFFRDGVMYIMRDGKIYDLTGKPAELDKLLLNR